MAKAKKKPARRRKMTAIELRHQMDRMIIGNQLVIMRAIASLGDKIVYVDALFGRVKEQKTWWRETFGEEVGFESRLGDEPPQR